MRYRLGDEIDLGEDVAVIIGVDQAGYYVSVDDGETAEYVPAWEIEPLYVEVH